MRKDFIDWILTCTKRNGDSYSKRTAEHYESGMRAISEEMIKTKVIDKPLEKMNLVELDLALALIFKNNRFLKKDEIGNKMYSNSLKHYRCFIYLNTEVEKQTIEEEKKVMDDTSITATEKESIIKARIGQGKYRSNLLQRYNNECVITKVNIKQVLVASHIKPWVVCSNKERLDVYNGLILSATFDKLFDSGLITFNENGEIKLSSLINKKNAERLHLIDKEKYDIKYDPKMRKYLRYHNENIFVA